MLNNRRDSMSIAKSVLMLMIAPCSVAGNSFSWVSPHNVDICRCGQCAASLRHNLRLYTTKLLVKLRNFKCYTELRYICVRKVNYLYKQNGNTRKAETAQSDCGVGSS